MVEEMQQSSIFYFIEWLDGNPNLDGSDFSLLWIYLVFMNGLWVVIPLLLLWDSFARLTQVSNSFSEVQWYIPYGSIFYKRFLY